MNQNVPVEAPSEELLRRKMSFAEFENLPDSEYFRVEWVDGTAIIMVTPLAYSHGQVMFRLASYLEGMLPDQEVLLIPGLRTRESAFRVPDLMVINKDQLTGNRGWLKDAPTLVVEVLSPSTWREDLGPKAAEYAAMGTAHYWTIDTEVPSLTARTNVGNAWRVDEILNVDHPKGNLSVGDSGTVTIDLAMLFRW